MKVDAKIIPHERVPRMTQAIAREIQTSFVELSFIRYLYGLASAPIEWENGIHFEGWMQSPESAI